MSEAYLGEIRMFAFNFAPAGWALADGSILQTREHAALHALYSTAFGGDAKNFALPDLRGRVPIGMGASDPKEPAYKRGEAGGSETVRLTLDQVPRHSHALNATSSVGQNGSPAGRFMAKLNVDDLTPPSQRYLYAAPTAQLTALNPGSLTPSGGSASHSNMQPFAVINFCVCMKGNFPPRG